MRSYYIAFNGFKFHKFVAISDIPQGSNIESIIFLLFFDDITIHKFERSVRLFVIQIFIFEK